MLKRKSDEKWIQTQNVAPSTCRVIFPDFEKANYNLFWVYLVLIVVHKEVFPNNFSQIEVRVTNTNYNIKKMKWLSLSTNKKIDFKLKIYREMGVFMFIGLWISSVFCLQCHIKLALSTLSCISVCKYTERKEILWDIWGDKHSKSTHVRRWVNFILFPPRIRSLLTENFH